MNTISTEGKFLRKYARSQGLQQLWIKTLHDRTTYINDATTRTNYAFMIMALVSAGLFFANYAYFFSWNRKTVQDYTMKFGIDHHTADKATEMLIQEWSSVQTYQLPVLGLKMMASDLSIFAPIVLMIVSMWFFFVVRKEHFSLAIFLADAKYALEQGIKFKTPQVIIEAQALFHKVNAYSLFNGMRYDKVIRSFEDVTQIDIYAKPSRSSRVRSAMVNVVLFAPTVAIVFIFSTRILTFFVFYSPFTHKLHSFSDFNLTRKILFSTSFLLSCLGIIVTLINSFNIIRYFKYSRLLLGQFQKWAFEEPQPDPDQSGPMPVEPFISQRPGARR